MKKRKSGKVYDVKKTIVFRLLVIALCVLLFLILLRIGLPVGEEDLEGELGTLKWDFDSGRQVVLDVLEYNITDSNQTIDVNINWTSGNQTINAMFMNFEINQGECNYTTWNLMEFNKNKSYRVPFGSVDCFDDDFMNVTNVLAYAQIHVNLTQTTIPIPDITIYNDDSLSNLVDSDEEVIDLDNYFSSLVNISYIADESPDNDEIEFIINETTHKLSITIGRDWFGTQRFNLTASEIGGGDVLNITSSGENMSFNVIIANANRPIPNEPPEFDEDCDSFTINVNVSSVFKKDMSVCWNDSDRHSLEFSFNNDSMKNITWKNVGENITLTAHVGFKGDNYFYMYADDGIVTEKESSGKIYVFVINSSNVSSSSQTSNTTKITSSTLGTEIHIFPGKNKVFSITAENHHTINWYLDGLLVKTNSSSYDTGNLSVGDYIVRVDVIGEAGIDSKIWSLGVSEDVVVDDTETPEGIDVMQVIFWVGIAIIGIIIGLVVWLFIDILIKKRREKRQIGFGISAVQSNQSVSNKFNIPKG